MKIYKTGMLILFVFLLLGSISVCYADSETISFENSTTSFQFVSSSANPDDGRIILTDPSYEYPDFYVWYGGSNEESVGNWSVYDYVIIKNNSDSSWVSDIASQTETFGYVYIGDYGINNSENEWNRTIWIINKTNDIDNWTETSASINILFDLIGTINDTDDLFNDTLLNNLTNYVEDTKLRNTLLNINGSYNQYYNYSNYTLRADVCQYWNGTNYEYTNISDDISIADFYSNNNASSFISSVGNVTDYETAYYCYMRNKVIFGDSLNYSFSQRNFSVESEEMINWNHFKYPNVGLSVDSNYSTNGDVYSRVFNNGTISINTTSNTVSYTNDYQLDYIEFCTYYEDRDDGALDEGFMVHRINDNMSEQFLLNDNTLVESTKTWRCTNLSNSWYKPSGFYELEFWYVDSDANYLNNRGMYLYHGTTAGKDKLSFYESILNDHESNDETSYTAYDVGDNWAVNFTINRILNVLNLTLNNPIDYYNTSNNSIIFGATINSDSYSSATCNLTIDDTVNQTNQVFNNNVPKNITVNDFSDGNHLWNISCWDADGFTNNSETRTFNVDLTPPSAPEFTSDNLTAIGDGTINLTWSIVSDAVEYMVYGNTSNFTIVDDSLWVTNTTNNYYQDNTTSSGTEYWYRIVAIDNLGNYNYSNASLSQNITAFDTIIPNLPTTVNVTQSSNTATITWSNVLTDVEGNSDSTGLIYQIWFGTEINMSQNQINNTLTLLKNISDTNSTTYAITTSSRYYFVVTTVDDGDNENLSFSNNNMANVSLTYTAPSDSPSSGGGGGGGSGGGGGGSSINGITYLIELLKDVEIKKELKKADKIKFNFKSNSHSITINNIFSNSVELIIQSTPKVVNILIGETEKVDIDDDGILDLSIKLHSIFNETSNLSITQIEEKAPIPIIKELSTNVTNNINQELSTNVTNNINQELGNNSNDSDNIQKDETNNNQSLLIGMFFLFIIIGGGLVYYFKYKKSKK